MVEQVQEFLDALSREMPRCDAEWVGAERYGAPRLSAFELLGTKENTLSDVIADLLDPRGTHGQGTLFLNALLRRIDEPVVHARDAVRITREFATKQKRRVDIVVETPASLIGIENKPFAGQGDRQLSDYYADLVDRAGGRVPRLIFLSDSEPETARDETTVLRFYDWGEGHPSFSGLLDEVRNDIRAPRVKAFVDDFRDWIARHFGGEEMTNELGPYADEVLTRFERPADRKAIGAVLLAGVQIRNEVIDRIGQHIWTVLSETYPDLEGEEGELSGWINEKHCPWGMRRPSWPTNCALTIEAHKPEAANIFYGVRALKPGTTNAKHHPDTVCDGRDLFEDRLRDIANGSSNDWWPWWQYAPTSTWSQGFVARLLIEANGHIEEHDDVKRMTADMVRLAEAIEEALGTN